MATFNVDEFLKKNGVTIELGDKKFHVNDIPYDMKDKLKNIEDGDIRETLKGILKCEDEDLAPYGFAAFSAILQHITKNLFETDASQ